MPKILRVSAIILIYLSSCGQQDSNDKQIAEQSEIKKGISAKEREEFKESIKDEIEFCEAAKIRLQETSKSDANFPCTVANYNGVNRVTIESDAIGFYFEFLADHLLYGNGYSWEGIIEQYLEKNNNTLLKELDFDSENDTFVVYCSSVTAQKSLVETIHNLCMNENTFSHFLNDLDRSRIY